MNYDQFTYWLQGFVEINNGQYPSPAQWQIIKDHLKLCFNKVTPTYPQLDPYRINPIQPPFKVTCTSYPFDYANLNKYPRDAGKGGGIKRNGGGGGC